MVDYAIPFYQQKNIPNSPKSSQEERILVQKELHKILNTGAIVETLKHLEGEFINLFLVGKENGEGPTSNNLETPKSVHTLPALQDGSFVLSLKRSKKGRLHVQTGSEECILISSIKSCIQKVFAVSLVGETVKVFLSLFCTMPSTQDFYKIIQNCSFSFTSPEHTNYNLLGRRIVDRPYNRRNVNGQRHSNLPSSAIRFCTEFKQISVDTYTENRFLRGDSRFIIHDPVSTRQESLQSSEAVSRTSSENTCRF